MLQAGRTLKSETGIEAVCCELQRNTPLLPTNSTERR
ncbi:hypothetical protein ACVMB3_004545 [Sinorhizobium meliloti]